MADTTLQKALTENESKLLKGYASYQYSIKDLAELTGYSYKKIHSTLNAHFHEYMEERDECVRKMYIKIQRYVNAGIPVDIFFDAIPLLSHLKQTKSLLQSIKRMEENQRIFLKFEPITLFRFKNYLLRVKIKHALIRNSNARHPVLLKHIADDYNVSESLVFKIHRKMPPADKEYSYHISEGIEGRVERLYKIYQLLIAGEPPSNIKSSYMLNDEDLMMINKIFKVINLE